MSARGPRIGRRSEAALLAPGKTPAEFAADVQFLRDALEYRPLTGEFVWKRKVSRQVRVGALAAGDTCHGYRRISIANNRIRAHQLAWVMVHGKLPDGVIDHINGDRSDNRLENLRDIPHAVNDQNRRKFNSSTGYMGVSRCSAAATFRASVGLNGKVVWSGNFATPELAHSAYLDAKRRHHVGCHL